MRASAPGSASVDLYGCRSAPVDTRSARAGACSRRSRPRSRVAIAAPLPLGARGARGGTVRDRTGAIRSGDGADRGVVAEGRSAFAQRVVSASSATRSAAGVRASSRTWTRPRTAHNTSAMISTGARRLLSLVPRVPVRLGSRRAARGGDVELELHHRLADHARRVRRNSTQPPAAGRAPGWDAGVTIARRGTGR